MKSNGLGGLGKGLNARVVRVTMDNDMDEDDDTSFTPDMSAAGDFIGRLLMSAPIVHILHLQTDSFAKHLALGELYTALPSCTDSIAEEFQGNYGIIPSYDTYAPMNTNPVIYVEDLLAFVRSNRKSMGPCSSLQSSIDELVTVIKSALYKLKNLK